MPETDHQTPSPWQHPIARRRVVITGVGALSPLGLDASSTWDGMLAGRSGISRITSFDTEGHKVHIAGQVRGFDPAQWLEIKDIKRLDRVTHLALAASQMAVDDAGELTAHKDCVATIFSSGMGGVQTFMSAVNTLEASGPGRVPPMTIPGGIVNISAGVIAMRFGFGGPNLCPVTACASSSDAIGFGYRLVRDGYADACLAGGAEAALHTISIAGFANLRALSTRNDEPERASRPFDAERDGFVMAEGAAALILEPLEDALRRGAPIYAEICGYGQTADAFHETAPQPEGAAAARAILASLAESGVQPEQVGYINAHGTSTVLSDALETRAIRRALNGHADHVAVSSTKSMTGHMLGAAGAIEAMAAALTLRDQVIPPTINYEQPDPRCDLDYVANEARHAAVDVALSNSMGFGGHNVCLTMRRFAEAGA